MNSIPGVISLLSDLFDNESLEVLLDITDICSEKGHFV